MRKKFALASILAVLLLVLSGSGARSTYSAATMPPDACGSACVEQLYQCIASGQPQGRCLGQYHKCFGQCK
jgi:hypothetical protein